MERRDVFGDLQVVASFKEENRWCVVSSFASLSLSLSLFLSLSLSLSLSSGLCLIYWPSTVSPIKRCTCVNKRKNSGSRWPLENNITRCRGSSSQLETGCRSESQLQTEGFGSLVTPGWATLAKMRKKCCYGRRRTCVNIAIRPCLHSFHTHNKHHPFENRMWEIFIYIKKCIRSFIEVVIISWLCSRVY